MMPRSVMTEDDDAAGQTRDEEAQKRMNEDESLFAGCSMKTAYLLCSLWKIVKPKISNWSKEIPLQLHYGSDDKIVDGVGIQAKLFPKIKDLNNSNEFFMYEHCRHALHEEVEPERSQFVDRLVKFVGEHR